MTERVGIVAVAQTKYEAAKPQWRPHELTYQVVEKVLEETGLTFAKDGTGIDGTLTCSSDHWDGRSISDITHGEAAGAHLRPEEKVCIDGANAVAYGFLQVLSGHYDVVLVTAAIKESKTNGSIIENFAFDPIFHQKIGLDFLQAAALQATRYLYKYDIPREQCAKVVVKNRHNGLKNPYAQLHGEVKLQDVLSSKMICNPITSLEAKPISDGACALILAKEEKAKKLTKKPIWITGIGQCYDTHNLGDRELAVSLALESAAKQACKMAGISEPRKELSLAEVSEHYAYQELLWTEGLGFCGRGEGGKLIDSGATEIGGEIPVNASGGVLSGNPRMVAGMARVIECVLQLRGEAGERQINGARIALAHGADGPCGQQHCVLILEKGF